VVEEASTPPLRARRLGRSSLKEILLARRSSASAGWLLAVLRPPPLGVTDVACFFHTAAPLAAPDKLKPLGVRCAFPPSPFLGCLRFGDSETGKLSGRFIGRLVPLPAGAPSPGQRYADDGGFMPPFPIDLC